MKDRLIINVAGNVLNFRRCNLDSARAEKLILSAFRYIAAAAGRKRPRLPSFCVIESDNNYDDNEIEQIKQEAVAWKACFEEIENPYFFKN